MPRPCSVCGEIEGVIVGPVHPKRAEIDSAMSAGVSYRNIAKRCGTKGTSPAVLSRHKQHIKTAMVKASQQKEVTSLRAGMTLLQRLQKLANDAEDLFKESKETGDTRAAVVLIREIRETLKTLLDIEAEAAKSGGDKATDEELTAAFVESGCETCVPRFRARVAEIAARKR